MKRLLYLIYTICMVFSTNCIQAIAQTSQVEIINQAQFKSLVGDYSMGFEGFKMIGNKPVVLDIYATWCGPCKRLSPILDELATEYKGMVDFYKIDLDKNRGLGDAFGVQSIPMIVFFPVKGKPQYIMGLYPKNELKEVVDYMFFKNK